MRRLRRRPLLLAAFLAGVLALAGGTVALSAGGGEPAAATAAPPAPVPEPLPAAPRPRPQLVEPQAGGAPAVADEADAGADEPEEATPSEDVPVPALPAEADPSDAAATAEVLDNGVAIPPLTAPPEVEAIIEAGNVIARSPYKWGGGHGKWQDDGYDCSGSVSYALASAGLLGGPLNSGALMGWGKPGKGKWITIYTNEGHVFMEVAGVRFDTIERARSGSRWGAPARSTKGYVARHPAGL